MADQCEFGTNLPPSLARIVAGLIVISGLPALIGMLLRE
jgi:hypothetical protein